MLLPVDDRDGHGIGYRAVGVNETLRILNVGAFARASRLRTTQISANACDRRLSSSIVAHF